MKGKGAIQSIDRKTRRLDAGFSIEAAVVMPTVIIALVGMILFSYKLHDIVTADLAANEAAEIYGHMLDDSDTDTAERYGAKRMDGLFSGREYQLSLEKYKDGSVVSISGEEGVRTYEDKGFSPHTFMRKLTVLEEIADNEP